MISLSSVRKGPQMLAWMQMLWEAGGWAAAREGCLQVVASGWAVEYGEGFSRVKETSR